MNMRAIVGGSLNSSHLEQREWESAIDRVGALGRCSKLGRLMYHWIYAHQDEMAGPVLKELLRKARRRFQIAEAHTDHKTLVRACKQAMLERRNPQCSDCRGARELINGNLRIVCQSCAGSGLRLFPINERMESLKVDVIAYKRVWDSRMADILAIMSRHDAMTAGTCRHQLRSDA